ncbi:hypothetical protein BFJ70_g16364 [Fusarium oxysporum]|nr:hypothetical protein BFJ70_g16364 [Fusarium oxysporum]
MPHYKTHVTVLQKTATANPLVPALKIPQLSSNGELQGWKDISYSQFLHDVEQSAMYWSRELVGKGANAGSVIGIWLRGTTYLDILHIWGITRAGYIPQLISSRLPSHTVVRELLTEAGAKGLIHEPAVTPSVGEDVFVFPAIDFLKLNVGQYPLPELRNPASGEDIVFIMHTSGSTSGKPKLVPTTVRWLDCNIDKFRHFAFRPPGIEVQETIPANGSFCHIGCTQALIALVDRGGCMVLPTSIPYSVNELKRMVKECKITTLNMFSSFMADVIRQARKDPEVLAMLQHFDACTHGGLPLDEKEGAWAREQGVNLINAFASTEVGCLMISRGGQEGQYLRLWPGSTFELRPISLVSDAKDGDASSTANGASSEKLVELVVPKHAPECPHHSLCDKKTGEFVTGDIFLQVGSDLYIPKGRNDDWIKMEISLRCDTRSIEQNALEACEEDLISAAVVVGAARPSPALLIEAKQSGRHNELPAEILRRIAPFHMRRYTHERIVDSRLIIVVPRGSFPRTPKGTIQRKLVERNFKNELDQIYSEVYS